MGGGQPASGLVSSPERDAVLEGRRRSVEKRASPNKASLETSRQAAAQLRQQQHASVVLEARANAKAARERLLERRRAAARQLRDAQRERERLLRERTEEEQEKRAAALEYRLAHPLGRGETSPQRSRSPVGDSGRWDALVWHSGGSKPSPTKRVQGSPYAAPRRGNVSPEQRRAVKLRQEHAIEAWMAGRQQAGTRRQGMSSAEVRSQGWHSPLPRGWRPPPGWRSSPSPPGRSPNARPNEPGRVVGGKSGGKTSGASLGGGSPPQLYTPTVEAPTTEHHRPLNATDAAGGQPVASPSSRFMSRGRDSFVEGRKKELDSFISSVMSSIPDHPKVSSSPHAIAKGNGTSPHEMTSMLERPKETAPRAAPHVPAESGRPRSSQLMQLLETD